jgi:hypothetical protein
MTFRLGVDNVKGEAGTQQFAYRGHAADSRMMTFCLVSGGGQRARQLLAVDNVKGEAGTRQVAYSGVAPSAGWLYWKTTYQFKGCKEGERRVEQICRHRRGLGGFQTSGFPEGSFYSVSWGRGCPTPTQPDLATLLKGISDALKHLATKQPERPTTVSDGYQGGD